MDKERQAKEAEYRERLRKNEQALLDLTKQKRELEEKRNALFAGKKETAAYLNAVQNELRGEDAADDMRELEELNAQMQGDIRRAEQEFEREDAAIETRRKELELQKEETENEYCKGKQES